MDDGNPEPPDVGDVLRDSAKPTIEVFLDLAMQIWWFWLLVGAVLLFRFVAFIVRQRRLSRSGIHEIDAMVGPRFEQYLATMFKRLGYRAEVVGSSRGDYGGDLVIRKNGTRTIVQAKRYGGKKVGVKAVQEAHAARSIYDCTGAMVVTNSSFTQQAKKLAQATGVVLWGRDELIKNLLKAQDAAPAAESEPEPIETDATAASTRPTCAKCGAEVSAKVAAYCADNVERFGGLVYCYVHQRGFPRTPRST